MAHQQQRNVHSDVVSSPQRAPTIYARLGLEQQRRPLLQLCVLLAQGGLQVGQAAAVGWRSGGGRWAAARARAALDGAAGA